MIRKLHLSAATLVVLCTTSFCLSTVVSELFMSLYAVNIVKQAIFYGLGILIPALIITAATGFAMTRKGAGGALIARKKKRMPIIAAIGLLVMLPSAIFLAYKAENGAFDSVFQLIQTLELIGAGIQIALISFSFRDGLRLTGRLSSRRQKETIEAETCAE